MEHNVSHEMVSFNGANETEPVKGLNRVTDAQCRPRGIDEVFSSEITITRNKTT